MTVENLSKSIHICSLFDSVKQNDFNEFLIVLSDYYYYYGWFCFYQNDYDIIMSHVYNFPGKIHVKYESEIRNDMSGDFTIKGMVQLKTLYIKLPKENIYVASHLYQEELFESKFNELLNIFAVLNAQYVDFYFQNMDEYMSKMSSVASFVNVGGDNNVSIHNKTQSNRRMRIEYSDKSHKIFDPEKFKDKKTFYYLPKEHGWRNVIKHRLENKMLKQQYTYNYSEYSEFNVEFHNCLKKLNIQFSFDTKKYNRLKIDYLIEYWPNKPVEPDHLRFTKCMREITTESNIEDFDRKLNLLVERRKSISSNNVETDYSAIQLLKSMFEYVNPMNMFSNEHYD